LLGLKNPYLVLLSQNLAAVINQTKAIGFDALSSYGINGGGTLDVNYLSFLRLK